MTKTIQEKYKEELSNFKETVTGIVLSEFKKNEEIATIMFGLIIKEDKLVVVMLAGLDQVMQEENPDIEKLVDVIKKFNKELRPVAIAMVTECWVKVYTKEGEILSDHDKMHCLMLSFETHSQDACDMYEILNVSDNLKLKKMNDASSDWNMKNEETFHGPLCNLLEDNYNEFAEMLKKDLNKIENLN